jgi:3-methyladenine DNA glycosylase AlkC
MSFSLKDQIFNKVQVTDLAVALHEIRHEIDVENFVKMAIDDNWEQLELKERMRHLTQCLYRFLPKQYDQAVGIMQEMVTALKDHKFANLIFPDYVEVYGLNHLDLSLDALELFTQYGSSEFAIRPFILRYEEPVMQRMYQWAVHENFHVRRLASEGCRPRLPWAIALPKFKKDPRPILPILEELKADPEDYVYRSVANNLNDISKDNPELVLDLAASWIGAHPHTDWAVKHALRTLLKQGNTRAMRLFGFGDPENIQVSQLLLNLPVKIGEELHFSFVLTLKEKAKVRLEYAVDYLKKRGSYSRKVFKITEGELDQGTHRIQKKQWFKDFSTRKHYPGEHFLSMIVNGVDKEKVAFELKNKTS